MSVTDAPEPRATHRRGGLGQRRSRRVRSSTPTASRPHRFPVTHDAAGLQHPGPPAARRRCGPRSGSNAPTARSWTPCCAAGLTVLRHPARPAQEPAQPLRLGREQGRPLRRLRAGRCGAHRPAPAAPAAGRRPGHHRAAPDCARPARPGRPPGRGGQPAARPPADRVPRRGRAVRRHRLRRSACASWSASPPRTAPTGSRPKRLAAWLSSVGYSGRTDPETLHARLRDAPAGSHRPGRRHRRHRHRRVRRRAAHPHHPDPGPRRPASPNSSTCTPTPRSSPACPAPAASAPPGCSPRSATPAAGSPPPTRWPAWPGSHPPPASPARSKSSASAGARTNNSATRSATSPATAATPTPGPPTSTAEPAPAATTTRTPCASWPAPGSTSSGPAGPPTPPTTPPNTEPCNASSTKINRRRLDTGQLRLLADARQPRSRRCCA